MLNGTTGGASVAVIVEKGGDAKGYDPRNNSQHFFADPEAWKYLVENHPTGNVHFPQQRLQWYFPREMALLIAETLGRAITQNEIKMLVGFENEAGQEIECGVCGKKFRPVFHIDPELNNGLMHLIGEKKSVVEALLEANRRNLYVTYSGAYMLRPGGRSHEVSDYTPCCGQPWFILMDKEGRRPDRLVPLKHSCIGKAMIEYRKNGQEEFGLSFIGIATERKFYDAEQARKAAEARQREEQRRAARIAQEAQRERDRLAAIEADRQRKRDLDKLDQVKDTRVSEIFGPRESLEETGALPQTPVSVVTATPRVGQGVKKLHNAKKR